MKTILSLILCLTLCAGCATQHIEKTAADGTKTLYTTRAVFNKTAFTNVSVDKKTKTTDSLFSVGAYGAESQGDQLVALFETLFNAGVQAGVKAGAPIPK